MLPVTFVVTFLVNVLYIHPCYEQGRTLSYSWKGTRTHLLFSSLLFSFLFGDHLLFYAHTNILIVFFIHQESSDDHTRPSARSSYPLWGVQSTEAASDGTRSSHVFSSLVLGILSCTIFDNSFGKRCISRSSSGIGTMSATDYGIGIRLLVKKNAFENRNVGSPVRYRVCQHVCRWIRLCTRLLSSPLSLPPMTWSEAAVDTFLRSRIYLGFNRKKQYWLILLSY